MKEKKVKVEIELPASMFAKLERWKVTTDEPPYRVLTTIEVIQEAVAKYVDEWEELCVEVAEQEMREQASRDAEDADRAHLQQLFNLPKLNRPRKPDDDLPF